MRRGSNTSLRCRCVVEDTGIGDHRELTREVATRTQWVVSDLAEPVDFGQTLVYTTRRVFRAGVVLEGSDGVITSGACPYTETCGPLS